MNCKLKSFHGNEGVVGLSRWIEKVESEIEIRFYAEICKVKFAFCNLTDASMSWWISHVKTIGISIVNAIYWSELKQIMIEESYPCKEMQKLDHELLNLTMKEANIVACTNCINNLTTLCPRLVTPEDKNVERYIWGLSHSIQGLVTASKPTTYDSAKRLDFNLKNQKACHGTMVQKDDLPRVEGKKRKFGKESN